MKVAHMVVVTPRRCGLYETTRELVAGLRVEGVDSRTVDPTRDKNKLHPDGTEDRGALFADMEWATEADVIVNHSGYDGTPVAETEQPVIHVAHGRPRHSFNSEISGGVPVYSYQYQHNKDPRWKAIVTFWPEHLPYHRVMFPDKPVRHVQAPVDLQAWTPGPRVYGFSGKRGAINVVCTDAFRDDIDPFVPLNVFALWARKAEGARLHVYAKPAKSRGWDALLRRLADDGNLGEVQGWVDRGLEQVYRTADFLLTGHTIATRSVREALASGCPVIRVPTIDMQIGLAMDRAQARGCAERDFDPAVTAQQFKRVLDAI